MIEEIRALEAQIRAKPEDLELRAVHADAVLERGEPGDRVRGQLIHLALAGERGDQAAARKAWTMQRKARARLVNALDRRYVLRMTWRHGSVESISIELRMWSGGTSLLQARTLAALHDLFAAPEVFALRALDTRPSGDVHVESLVRLVEHLPLRWLGISGACTTPDELAMVRTLPQLDGLGLHTHDPAATLAMLDGQTWLRDLELSGIRAPFEPARFPQLTRLVLYGLDTPAELEPILELPELRDLGLMGTLAVTSWMLQRLEHSPVLPRLRSLGFSAATLYDAQPERDWLIAHREAFAHLRLFAFGFQPDHDRGHEAGRLGLLFDALGRTRDSIDDHQHHLDHSGGDRIHAGCWGRFANALIANAQPAEAVRAAERGLEVMGDAHADAAYLLRTQMWALLQLERYAEAAVAAERALAVDDHHAWTWRVLGQARVELARFDDALAAYDRGILEQGDAPDPWQWLLRGELRWGRGEVAGAVADLERALPSTDDVIRRRVQTALGSIAYQRGDFVTARGHFVDALASSYRDQPAALIALCATLYQLGELSIALTTRQVATFDGLDGEEQGHLLLALGRPADVPAGIGGAKAMALHALGRTADAIVALDHYGARPNHPEPACGYRHAIGLVLHGLLAGEPARFAELATLPVDPVALHAALLADDSTCTCVRHATVAVLAAAIASGDHARATALATAFAAYQDARLNTHPPALVWDLRSVLRLSPSPLLAAALATLEHGAPTSAILAQAARGAGS